MKLDALDKHLEAIRIRVRMADVSNDDGSFKLGFNFAGQKLGISLNKVDRAGAAGVVDLATYWFPPGLRGGGPSVYEQAVPKVILFDQ